jgi:cell division protein FtsA
VTIKLIKANKIDCFYGKIANVKDSKKIKTNLMNIRSRVNIEQKLSKLKPAAAKAKLKVEELSHLVKSKKAASSSTKEQTTDHSEQVVVALDIGTEYVKALIGRINGQDIDIIGVGRKHQSLTDMYAGAIADIAGAVDNCDAALADAENMAKVRVSNAVLGIAGELVRGITYTITYKRAKPEDQITPEEMQIIIEKAQQQSKLKAAKALSEETGEPDIDIKLVNSAIVAMYVDGYKISNPIGFQGAKLSIRLYSAFAPMVHIGALQQVARQLELEPLAIAAEPFAVSRTVIGTDPSSSVTSILIDVGGGTTDVAFVEDGGVQGTRSFGIGGRSFTKAIAEDLNLSFASAEKLKINLSSDQYTAEQRASASKAIEKTADIWLSGVELAIAEFVEEQGEKYGSLPSIMMLCGGGSSLRILPAKLNDPESNWYKNLPFIHKPKIGIIRADAAKGIEDKTSLVNDHTYITALGLLRVAQDTASSIEPESKTKKSIRNILKR